MSARSRMIGSFFSVAMGAMLVGAFVTAEVGRPGPLALGTPLAHAESTPRLPGGPLTLDTFRDIAKHVTDGVVNISTSKVVKKPRFHDPFGESDLMDRFFGPQQGPGAGGAERETQRSLGSGFVISEDGYVMTNRHVVEGADQIQVQIDGQQYEAKLKGMDARTDVALLKVEPKGKLTTLALGDSDQTEVGEWVIAIGNPFGLGGNSVTAGIVSYKGRPLTLGTQGTSVDMIQTDASINPGNSGGPLLNTRGEVIGINTLIITRGLPQSAGVGFAVPINVAKEILPQLREKGKVTRGWMGVQIQTVTEDMAKTFKMKEAKGALVSDVTPDSPADKAGLKPDDVIVAADGQAIADNGALSSYIAKKAPGTAVRLSVLRGGAPRDLTVTLGVFPDEVAAAAEGEDDAQAQLGMSVQTLTPALASQLQLPRTAKGVVVTSVEAGEAAEDAGLQRGDLIVSVNGVAVDGVEAFLREVAAARPDGVARLRVRRGDNHSFLVLKLH